jgi:hypothetical protein
MLYHDRMPPDAARLREVRPTPSYRSMTGALTGTVCSEAMTEVGWLAERPDVNPAGRALAVGFSRVQLETMLKQIEDEETRPEQQDDAKSEVPESRLINFARKLNVALCAAVGITQSTPDVQRHPRVNSVWVAHYQVPQGDSQHNRDLCIQTRLMVPQIETEPSSIIIHDPEEERQETLTLPLDSIRSGAPNTAVLAELTARIDGFNSRMSARHPQRANANAQIICEETQDQLNRLKIITNTGTWEFVLGRVRTTRSLKSYFEAFGQIGEPHAIGVQLDYDTSGNGLVFTPYISIYEKEGENVLLHKYFGIPFSADKVFSPQNGGYTTIDTLRELLES